MPQEVTLGKHTYTVDQQPIGWLENQLGDKLSQIADSNFDTDNLIGALSSQAYPLLRVFIPDLMPEWEFRGFASKEAFEAKEYDRAADNSPGPASIKEAFRVALKENADVGAALGNALGPDLIRALVRKELSARLSGPSQSSPQANGASDPESSGTAAPSPATPSSPPSSESPSGPEASPKAP